MMIVVADSSRCKLYVQELRNGELSEKASLVHTDSRLHDRDISSDRPGSDHGSAGQGRHPMPSRTDPVEHQMDTFAHDIAGRLDAGRTNGEFSHLVLVAPPAFLGTLRNSLNNELGKLVAGEVNKSLVKHSADEVREYLQRAM